MTRSTCDPRLLERVEDALRTAVNLAMDGHRAASSEFWRVCASQTGTDLQIGRQAKAMDKQNIAHEALLAAIVRLNKFITDGTIPEDLKHLIETKERTMGASG
jgi:hypothetical protein